MILRYIIAAAILVVLVSCRQTDEGHSGSCVFKTDTLASNSTELDLSADSSRTYSYQFVESKPDSILAALCRNHIELKAAYNDADYLCKDAIGPRFVVVLKAADSLILNQSFVPGNRGRFLCATKVVRYRPQ